MKNKETYLVIHKPGRLSRVTPTTAPIFPSQAARNGIFCGGSDKTAL